MRYRRTRKLQSNIYIIYNNIRNFIHSALKYIRDISHKLYQEAYRHTYVLPLVSLLAISFLSLNLFNPNTSTTTYATDEGIMLTANTTTPSASLSVSNSGEQRIDVQPGSGTVYSSHIVSMSSVNIASYALTISGPAELHSTSGKTILTGANGATGSGMGNNTWGYSYNKSGITSDSNAATFASFSGGNQSLESGSTPSTVQKSLILAARFSDNAEAGHYTGSVNLSLTATPKTLTTYSITYNANGGSGAPSNWSDSSYDNSYATTISSTKPTRSGYDFLGWSTSSSASSATYSAGQSITLSSSSPTLNLYAMWQLKSVTYTLSYNANSGSGAPYNQSCTTINASCSIKISAIRPTRNGYEFLGWATSLNGSTISYQQGDSITVSANTTLYAKWGPFKSFSSSLTTMQSMTSSICANASVGATVTLTDNRDGTTYTVAKLADGKCWMTQNLRLASGTVLTGANSNVSSDYTLPNSVDKTIMPDPANGQMTNSLNSVYGAYYSYNAATAGTMSGKAGNATQDICPKNWRLPTGSDYNNDFKTLSIRGYFAVGAWQSSSTTAGYWIGGEANAAGAAFFPAAGFLSSDGRINMGLSGDYNSSSSHVIGNTSALYFDKSNFIPATGTSGSSAGRSIRCIAK